MLRPAVCGDRARKNLDRHPNYILAAYMASGT
jgi:integrase/recombinase XerD